MIKFARPMISDEEKLAVIKVLDSGIFVHGNYTKTFEQKFLEFTKAKIALSYANCTLALQAAHQHAVETRNIDQGSEIICPAMSHVATSHAIECSGLKPIYCDCDESGNIDASQIPNLITKKTRGISLVHFNGVPADMTSIMKIADEFGLYVVEDCAIALGSEFNGQHVGLLGDYGCFSFHPVKQMTTGEGGMLISKHFKYGGHLKLQRAFGVTKQFNERKISGHYDVSLVGSNYRMAEIPSAIGLVQLGKVDQILSIRQKNYICLHKALKNNSFYTEVTAANNNELKKRSYYCFIAMLPKQVNRNDFQIKLRNRGLETSVYYPSPIPHFTFKNSSNVFHHAEQIAKHSIAIPVGPHLEANEINQIIDILLQEQRLPKSLFGNN